MNDLIREIIACVREMGYEDTPVGRRYIERAQLGALSRDENDRSHFCVYFLPYNPATGQVFYIHHKKSGLWLSPGGHTDKGENLLAALNREIGEELGVQNHFQALPKPFLLTITPIERWQHACREHLDIWFLLETDGSNMNPDPAEFLDAKWLSVPEALNIVTDPANVEALKILEKSAVKTVV